MSSPGLSLAPTRARWQALGTSAELLVLGDERQLALARETVEDWLAQVDLACSRFRADSELSLLSGANGQAMRVSPVLIEATQLALRAARLTDGDVDPTLGTALELAGYDRDWTLIEADEDRESAAGNGTAGDTSAPSRTPAGPVPRLRVRRRAPWTRVRVDPTIGTIELPRGVKLDLGATAKAWAADRAASIARAAGGCSGVLVSLGGDIATSGKSPPAGWRVHVTDDHRDGPDAPGQTITINAGGLATSSTAVRRWRRGETPMHHIIDPLTGAPARTPWRTVSVAAENCAQANIAATAAIVRGERAVQWLRDLGLPARLVARNGEVSTVGAWPGAWPGDLSQAPPPSQPSSTHPKRQALAKTGDAPLGSAA
ncbi:MAG: FAD:protein FMN transferase [Solirubrobacteraceae bacterium]